MYGDGCRGPVPRGMTARYDARVTSAPPPHNGPSAPAFAGPWAAPATARPPLRVWDVVLTIVFLVGDAVLALVMSFFGAFLAMASDPCGARDCNTDLITVGVLAAMALPWIFLVAGLVVSIVLLVKRRLAFWVPLVAAVLIIGSWFIGAAFATAGVPGS